MSRFEGLETELAGVAMRTPIGVGAINERSYCGKKTAEEWAEMLLKTVDAGAGYVIIATIDRITDEEIEKLMDLVRSEKEEYRIPSWQKREPPIPPKTDRSKVGLSSMDRILGVGMFHPGIRMGLEDRGGRKIGEEETGEDVKKQVMAVLKEKLPDNVPLIGSVTGYGSYPEGWLPSVKAAEDWGADLIVLNSSCPIPPGFGEYMDWYTEEKWPARYPGVGLLLRPRLFEKILRESVKSVHVPIGVKFSPEIGFPNCVVLAKRYKDAGAKYLTTLNSGNTILPPDIYNRGKPRTPHISGNIICGINGPFLRPINYKMVGSIKKHVPGIDVVAVGGIETSQQIVEFLMLGANAIQQVTAPLLKGRNLFRQEIAFLKKFLETQGFDSVKDLIGLHQQYLKDSELVYGTEKAKYVAKTDQSLCTGCGICVDLPNCMASYMKDGIAVVDTERCEACGWCTYACSYNARKLVRVD